MPLFREIDKISDENEEFCKPINETINCKNEASTSLSNNINETNSKLNNEIHCHSFDNIDKFYEDDNDITSAELITALDNAVEDDLLSTPELNHMLGNAIEYINNKNNHNNHKEKYVVKNISENQTILNEESINECLIKQNENINWRKMNETTPSKPNRYTKKIYAEKQHILSTSNNLGVTAKQRKVNKNLKKQQLLFVS